jgi:hypothetical protein
VRSTLPIPGGPLFCHVRCDLRLEQDWLERESSPTLAVSKPGTFSNTIVRRPRPSRLRACMRESHAHASGPRPSRRPAKDAPTHRGDAHARSTQPEISLGVRLATSQTLRGLVTL